MIIINIKPFSFYNKILARNYFQSFSKLKNLDTPALNVAKLIEDKILIPLESLDPSIPFSDHKKKFSKKIKKILERIISVLEPLSLRFWNRPLEYPVITEEVLAALVLKFLLGMHNSVHLEKILFSFQYSRFIELTNILKKIIASNELKSFNISGFLIFTDFKCIDTLVSEISFWRNNAVTEIKTFDDYFNDFIGFLSNNSLFIEYLKGLCNVDENTFNLLLDFTLKKTVLVQNQIFKWYGADGFTTYDRKIYIKLFETGCPVMNKAAIFYVLLHELCYYFRRISCLTWEDSRNCPTPETIIDNIPLSEAGNIFEIQFFGDRHRFLNKSVCEFFLSSTEKLSREEYSTRFAFINRTRERFYVSLMRGACLGGKDIVELSGCAISKHRGYD
ncbi:hypothetical protein SteCoe_26685 [Stentor coeruleus]|uniref:Uncharacterized protein n=1 Tax=Stentor coeruleus TaxID=5963 RepID=A0A1R2BC91_9CILI|nr:hypothetical protein SteCoe_26685 [Stentor coeruleus]